MSRILIIEDENTLCMLIRDVLEHAGYDVQTAFDGEQGTKLFYAQPHDLVITDILMPEKEGLEIILEFSQKAPETKIIAISGGGAGLGEGLLEMAQDFGAQHTLQKPIVMKELVALVRETLSE